MNNKPEWKDAPIWAKWVAQDEDGQWGWYEFEPELGGWSWIWDRGNWQACDFYLRANDWRKTLEHRP